MIVLNLIALCLDYHKAGSLYIKVTGIINVFFVILFTFEAAAKIIGLGHRFYFHNTDNIFDFIIVITSLTAVIFERF